MQIEGLIDWQFATIRVSLNSSHGGNNNLNLYMYSQKGLLVLMVSIFFPNVKVCWLYNNLILEMCPL
jgi:hypothetical protein